MPFKIKNKHRCTKKKVLKKCSNKNLKVKTEFVQKKSDLSTILITYTIATYNNYMLICREDRSSVSPVSLVQVIVVLYKIRKQ